MRFGILLSLLVLISCGKQVKIKKHFGLGTEVVDPQMASFFYSFVEKAKCLNRPLRYNSLSIQFGPLPAKSNGRKVMGLCERNSEGRSRVTIDGEDWQYLRYELKERLLYHELGHCALLKGHTPEDGDPLDVMFPSITWGSLYEYLESYDRRIKDLFDTDNPACSFAFNKTLYDGSLVASQSPSHDSPDQEVALVANSGPKREIAMDFAEPIIVEGEDGLEVGENVEETHSHDH